MSSKERLLELNTRLAQKLKNSGIEATANETTTSLVNKVSNIYNKGYDEGYAKGKAEGGDSGAVSYTKYAKTLTFDSSFAEVTGDVYLDLSSITTIANLLWGSSIGCDKITLKISNLCQGMNSTFRGSTNATTTLKEVEIQGDTSGITTYLRTFYNQYNLENIIGELDFSNATTAQEAFYHCDKLKVFTPKSGTIKVSISLSSSPNLSDYTIQSVINGLADLTGQTAQTLTLHATVKAKLTDIQIATITSKNWTLA